jgi:hypothetical protein
MMEEQYRLVDGKQIKHITSEWLSYVDDDGTEQYIDFSECYANFVRKMTAPDYWEHYKEINNLTDADWERHLGRLERWKEVGRIQPLTPPWADGQYIEFHTEPLTRFKFAPVEEFQNVGIGIIRTKWKFMDLG